MTKKEECLKALQCLYLEVDATIADDVKRRVLEALDEANKNFVLADVMLSLPTVKEIEAWAKEQAKIEPTGAEEFGRIWGAMWMRGLIEQKLKGNGA